MNDSIRYLAFEALLTWEKQHGPADAALETLFVNRPRPTGPDSGLLMHLFQGTIRWRGYLDWHLSRLATRPLHQIEPILLQALRVGLYQLLFMDRIPERAAVFETVHALKTLTKVPWLAGFANAVLRKASNQDLRHRRLELEDTMPDNARTSHPQWLLDRYLSRLPRKEALALCTANNTQADLVLNVNTTKIAVAELMALLQAQDIEVQTGTMSPTALRLPNIRGSVTALPGFSEGLFIVQDEAAQLVSLLLGPFQAGAYLDACAGVGGKTCHLSWLLQRDSTLTAIDPHPDRIRLLLDNLARIGPTTTVTAEAIDLATLAARPTDRMEEPLAPGMAQERPDRPLFQGILVDAPCSGLGVIRRHPDIRWNREEKDLPGYQEQQLALLDQATHLIAPGGILVYSVCSLEPEETDEVVTSFLATHPDFALTDPRPPLPPAAHCLVDNKNCLRTLPHCHGLDGFFAARFAQR